MSVRLAPLAVVTLQVRLSPRNTVSATLAWIWFQPAARGSAAACSGVSTWAFSGRTISTRSWPPCRPAVGRMARDWFSKLAAALPWALTLRKLELPRNEATKAFGGFW
ncbi:hypothetical protein D3C84_785820 [compost metagenome]